MPDAGGFGLAWKIAMDTVPDDESKDPRESMDPRDSKDTKAVAQNDPLGGKGKKGFGCG